MYLHIYIYICIYIYIYILNNQTSCLCDCVAFWGTWSCYNPSFPFHGYAADIRDAVTLLFFMECIRPVSLLRVWVSKGLTQADSWFSGVGILMSVEFYRESPGKFDSRTLSRKTLRWTGRSPSVACAVGPRSAACMHRRENTMGLPRPVPETISNVSCTYKTYITYIVSLMSLTYTASLTSLASLMPVTSRASKIIDMPMNMIAIKNKTLQIVLQIT